jgi:hypothetical protein
VLFSLPLEALFQLLLTENGLHERKTPRLHLLQPRRSRLCDQLAAGLRVGGIDPTIDRQRISGGEDWRRRLGSLIRDAETVVFVLSPSSARSETCDLGG